MIKICEHLHDDGSTCGSPALTGYNFCYFHQRLRHPRHRPGDFEYKLPVLDTPHAILMATQHITQAALDGILEASRARLVLSALRLAMTTLKAMNKNGLKKNDLLEAARPRAAGTTVDTKDSAAAAPPEGSPRREPWVSVTSTSPAPAGATDTKLSATQLKLMKKILRRGPSHPQFKLAARLLDRQISRGESA